MSDGLDPLYDLSAAEIAKRLLHERALERAPEIGRPLTTGDPNDPRPVPEAEQRVDRAVSAARVETQVTGGSEYSRLAAMVAPMRITAITAGGMVYLAPPDREYDEEPINWRGRAGDVVVVDEVEEVTVGGVDLTRFVKNVTMAGISTADAAAAFEPAVKIAGQFQESLEKVADAIAATANGFREVAEDLAASVQAVNQIVDAPPRNRAEARAGRRNPGRKTWEPKFGAPRR